MSKGDGSLRDLLPILAIGYRYKEISDYGLGPTASVTVEDATEMIEAATRFIERVAALLPTSPLA